jgi:16S rRNA processing protein RimM
MELSDPVVIGVAAGAHGVRGTLRVRPTGSGRHLREGAEVLLAGRRRRIERSRPTPKGFLLDLQGIDDRSRAASLTGAELVLDRAELDPAAEGEFYVADLVGLVAETESGQGLGRVRESFPTPAHEVLVISPRESAGEPTAREPHIPERYVPFTYEHVPEVDLEGGRLVVRLPEEEE